jgi:hypothetical protein
VLKAAGPHSVHALFVLLHLLNYDGPCLRSGGCPLLTQRRPLSGFRPTRKWRMRCEALAGQDATGRGFFARKLGGGDLTEHATKAARAIRNLGHAVGDHRDRCPCLIITVVAWFAIP